MFSLEFYCLYITAGLSDMVDGTIARKTHTVSELGSQLDTIADFSLAVVCLIKIMPTLNIQAWLYIWIIFIALIKSINVVSGYAIQKKFIALHTVMNKIAGVFLFILPLTLSFVDFKYSSSLVCAVATFAAIQEGYYIRIGR